MAVEEDLDTIYRAIQAELAENTQCPVVADLFSPLLKRISNGDNEALKLALKIAHDTITPRKPLFYFLHKHR